MTGILDFLECPCIRMEINDHAKTRSYKNRNMLNEKFFRVQLEYLKSGNIRAAVEMELTDIQAKFGSKYDDAINEARKYIAKLEENVKIMKKNGA